jgi:septum formation protein
LILASRSPQRRAILEQLGASFEVVAPDVEEIAEGPPREVAVENAMRKARAVRRSDAVVLGVDTIVALGSRIYGKPGDMAQAASTLRALAGRRHAVISGVCVIDPAEGERTAAAHTLVRFRRLDEDLLQWYLESGEWRERAGGYAIQGRGAVLVAGITGDYSNVVGLPVPTLLELLPGLLDPAAVPEGLALPDV